MPLTRCPKCAQRQLVSEQVIGQVIGCSRCERPFTASPLTELARLRDLIMVAAALAVGGIVTWIVLRGGV
jgi:hypothetical protein